MTLLNTHRTWDKVREEGCCRICGFVREPRWEAPPKCGWVTGHHLVPRAFSKREQLNIIPLCFRCHKIVDSQYIGNAKRRSQKRSELRAKLTEEEIAYANRIMGDRWLDRAYPIQGQEEDRAWAENRARKLQRSQRRQRQQVESLHQPTRLLPKYRS